MSDAQTSRSGSARLVPDRLRQRIIRWAVTEPAVITTIIDRLAQPGAMDATTRTLIEPLVRVFANDLASRPGEPHSAWLVGAISRAFEALYAPAEAHGEPPPAPVRRTIVDQFHRLYYHADPHPWERTYYRGYRILKLPSDLWIYRSLLDELRPSLVIETGTRFGGSALWLADQLELLGHGRVVTVDIEELPNRPEHERITYLTGSSTDPALRARILDLLPDDGGHVLVVLDSDHGRDHVLAELRTLSGLVTPGSYILVEDTNINGHPVLPNFGPGPMEAVNEFLAETTSFDVDRAREMFYFTMHPNGFLQRRPG